MVVQDANTSTVVDPRDKEISDLFDKVQDMKDELMTEVGKTAVVRREFEAALRADGCEDLYEKYQDAYGRNKEAQRERDIALCKERKIVLEERQARENLERERAIMVAYREEMESEIAAVEAERDAALLAAIEAQPPPSPPPPPPPPVAAPAAEATTVWNEFQTLWCSCWEGCI